jgi:chromosome segregation ATPase
MLMVTTTASAQTDVASLNDENARLETEIKTLTEKQKELSDSVKAQEGQIKTLETDIKKEEKALAKNQGKTNMDKVPELQKRQAQLQLFIDSYITEIQELNKKIFELDRLMEEFNKKRQNLENVRDNVGKKLIESNQDYLEKAFSNMDLNNLYSIKSDCDRYKDDKNVKQFIEKVDKVISMKQAFDNAINVLSQPFNRTNVNQALNLLPKTDMNNVQNEEMNTVRTKLQGFEQGLNTFKELINAIAKKRGTIFSKRDLDDELDIILKRDNLKGRINDQVMKVPYLKNKYQAYIKALQAEPTKQPAIEKEILEQ